MSQEQYEQVWEHPDQLRPLIDRWLQDAPELFPARFCEGYQLHGFGRNSWKLPVMR